MRGPLCLVALLALAALPAPAASDAPAWTLDGAPSGTAVQGIGGSESYLVASTFARGAFESRDGGASWSPIPAFPPVTKARVAWDSTDENVGYVAGYGGVARTVDGGASWSLVLSAARAARIDVGPTGLVLVAARYADASNHVLVSSDRGATWTDLAAPLPPEHALCGVAFGRNPQEVMTMTDRQSWFTHDGGATWTETPSTGFDFGIEDSGIVWRSDFGILQRTLDGGATWVDVPAPGFGKAIGAHPAGGVYVATTEGLALTRDAGATWTVFGYSALMPNAHALFADPRDHSGVFMGDAIVGISRLALDAPLEGRNTGLPPVPIHAVGGSAALLLAAGPNGAHASRDGGRSWAHAGAGVGYRATAVAAHGARAYVAGVDLLGAAVLEASVDGARSFAPAPLPPISGTPRALEAAGDLVFLLVETADGGVVLASRDAGATWDAILPTGALDLAWDAEQSELLAATLAGALAWSDDGLWTPLGGPPNATTVAAGGGARFAAGAGAAWRGGAAMTPWALVGHARDATVASDGALLVARRDGSLARCAGGLADACTDASAPDAVVAVAASSGSAFAASASGLWRARVA